jgi:hypothetical protein
MAPESITPIITRAMVLAEENRRERGASPLMTAWGEHVTPEIIARDPEQVRRLVHQMQVLALGFLNHHGNPESVAAFQRVAMQWAQDVTDPAGRSGWIRGLRSLEGTGITGVGIPIGHLLGKTTQSPAWQQAMETGGLEAVGIRLSATHWPEEEAVPPRLYPEDHPYVHPRVTGVDYHSFSPPRSVAMSDGSPGVPWSPSGWLKESPPRTRTLILGEGHGALVLGQMWQRGFLKQPDSFARAPIMTMDAAYGVYADGAWTFPHGGIYHRQTDAPPDPYLIATLQNLYPRHYRHGLFQTMDLRDEAGARLSFDEIAGIQSLGWALTGEYNRGGIEQVRPVLETQLDHLNPGGRLRIWGWDRGGMQSDFAQDLGSLYEGMVATGRLRAYNPDFGEDVQGYTVLQAPGDPDQEGRPWMKSRSRILGMRTLASPGQSHRPATGRSPARHRMTRG